MKKGAIFDMDDLLFDTERLFRDSWVEMAKQFGQLPQPEFPAAVAGTSGEGMRDVIRRYYPEVDAHAFQEGCIARTAEIIRQGPPEKPGMREILDFFQERDIRIAVASSSSLEMIRNNLRWAGITSYFDVAGTRYHGESRSLIFFCWRLKSWDVPRRTAASLKMDSMVFGLALLPDVLQS